MNNLFEVLELENGTSPDAVAEALRSARQDADEHAELDGISVARIEAVLGDETRLTHYRRVHDQYVAISAAMGLLDLPGTLDSHRWRHRTVEFSAD